MTMVRRIGNTVYRVKVSIVQSDDMTFEEAILRMIANTSLQRKTERSADVEPMLWESAAG